MRCSIVSLDTGRQGVERFLRGNPLCVIRLGDKGIGDC